MKKILNYTHFLFLNFLIKRRKRELHKGTLLIIKLDSIGDYVLLRNFFPFLKSKYKDYKFTYCGNIDVKEMVTGFDQDIFNSYIWIDRKKFLDDINYKKEILRDIYNRGFEVVINPSYSREILFGDQIAAAASALHTIGMVPSPDKSRRMNLLTDIFYTRLVPTSDQNLFEFTRYKFFFENLFGIIDIRKPHLTPPNDTKQFNLKDHIMLFPGAKEEKRRWSVDNFARIANFIHDHSGYKIVLAGGKSDIPLSSAVLEKITHKDRVTDITGSTTIKELVKAISECKLLISNETGSIHIAAALGIPFICISNGNHYGRFHPYPKEIFSKGYFLYSPELYKMDKEKLRYNSELNINTLLPVKVIDLFIKLAKNNFEHDSL